MNRFIHSFGMCQTFLTVFPDVRQDVFSLTDTATRQEEEISETLTLRNTFTPQMWLWLTHEMAAQCAYL